MAVRLIKWAAMAFVLAFFGVQVVRPDRTNPPVDPARTIAARMQVPPNVKSTLDRSCRDCHSHETRWPWYSNIAPVSWLLVDDVNAAREEMNLSEWSQYPPDEAAEILEDACRQTRQHKMPLPKYVFLHPEAKLSDQEIADFCAWTETLAVAGPSR